ncbi:ABC transporter permease [Telmatobacter sp. DSM 110680]|uniref:ABC transporter permease n=1 Tax=Telmatobacter sp. DSM 110680 TaxID=3036704 RepID=A0AAU7DL70_9BACT
MPKIRALWFRLCALFSPHRSVEQFDAELESHIEQDIDEAVRSGLNKSEARRQALLRLGGAEQARQAYRDRATLPWLESVLRDVRYALRGFRRNPVFAVAAILTLALGIGTTAAVFSVVDRILFRPLPYAHDDRLVSVGLTAPIIPQEFVLGGWYYEWRDHQTPFAALTSEAGVNACDLTEHNPAHLSCASVDANFLPCLGISPILGRNFISEEDRPNGPKVALISYSLWSSHFNRDPGVVNRLIDIDGSQVRVIGVLPSNFEMPALEQADLLVPQAVDESKVEPDRVMFAFARLKPGITVAQAAEQLQPEFNYALSQAPARFRSEVHLRVRSVRERQMQDAREAAWVLFGAVLAVLLIACANVASLLLTRATARERELAVRSALGASRNRLIRQALVESIILSVSGTAAGCALAQGLLYVFVAMAPLGLPFLHRAQLDGRILVFTVVLALMCGLAFGIIPALQRPRSIALAARALPLGARAGMRRILVAGQIAVSMILLAGAALLVRSFTSLQMQPLGMQTSGVVTASISLNRYTFTTPQSRMQFFLQAEAALRRLPGVAALALSDTVPPGGYHRDHIYNIMEVAGRPPLTGGTGGMVAWRWVTPDYFKALDIPILRGQNFTETQRTSNEHFMIISSSLASRLFPGQNPLGQRVKPVPGGPWFTVEGVAANVKNSGLSEEDEPEYYQLWRAEAEDWQQPHSAAFVVKTTLPPTAMSEWIRTQVSALDPTVPVEIETLNERVSGLADRPRFETALISFFAGIGLLMAIIGLYGVVSFMAVQRTQEIGIRMALGATHADVLRLILSEGFRLVLIGGAIGLLAALVLSRVLQSVLFSVSPHDPASFAAVTVLLALVALIAILIPARSAMKTDPVTALRWE